MVPCTKSVEIHRISTFSVERMLNTTRSLGSVHLVLSMAINEAFSWRWKRSTSPFPDEWFTAVLMHLHPNSFLKVVDSNCCPRSVVTVEGHLNCAIHLSMNTWQVVSAVTSTIGTASIQIVKRSTHVNNYSWPLLGGSRPTI